MLLGHAAMLEIDPALRSATYEASFCQVPSRVGVILNQPTHRIAERTRGDTAQEPGAVAPGSVAWPRLQRPRVFFPDEDDSTTVDRLVPMRIAELGDVAHVADGRYVTSAARRRHARVLGQGRDGGGETASQARALSVALTELQQVHQLATRSYPSCARWQEACVSGARGATSTGNSEMEHVRKLDGSHERENQANLGLLFRIWEV